MPLDLPVLEKGTFYLIKYGAGEIILEDRTKRGLEVKETSADDKLKVRADKGVIYDMDGIGHPVPIRWYFPKGDFGMKQVMVFAQEMEQKYTKLRELTCPDD